MKKQLFSTIAVLLLGTSLAQAQNQCGPGTTYTSVFSDDLESGAAGWTHSGTGDTWVLSAAQTSSGSNAWFATDPPTLSDQRLLSPVVVLPSNLTLLQLQFNNRQSFEIPNFDGRCWDAGVLEVTTDGGASFAQVAAAAITGDPYDNVIWNDTPGNNPITNDYGATTAWCSDAGGAFITAVVDLTAFAGTTAQFRWRLGSDSAASNEGWYIDDITIGGCNPDPVPTVTINQGAMQVDPTASNPITFDVLFSEPVTGFDASDIVITGTATASVSSVSGADDIYTVTVTATTNGTVIADIPADAAIDAGMQGNLASTSTDNTVTLADPAPTVTINQAGMQADPTASNPIVFDVVFSESVTGFDASDISLGGTATATVAGVSGAGAAYTVNVNASTSGTVSATVNAAGALDSLMQGNAASSSTDNEVTVDLTVPSVVSITGAPVPLELPGVATFTVVFSQAVTGVDATDFNATIFNGTGSITGVSGSGTTWTVTVQVNGGQGVMLALVDDDSIVNALNVPLGGVGAGNGNASGSLASAPQIVPALGHTGMQLMLALFALFGLFAAQRRLV